ncbi:MAG: phasin family protein [Caldilineaceae bacterium]|nr:phasin family protein [Caldilineaceae bacterium]
MSSVLGSETIPVIDVHNEQVREEGSLFDPARRIVLAGLGAVAFTIDEANAAIDKLAERGEVVKNNRQEKAQALRERLWARRKAILNSEGKRAKVAQTVQALCEGAQEIRDALSIPTKRDIESLRQEIDLLHQKIDRLSQQD